MAGLLTGAPTTPEYPEAVKDMLMKATTDAERKVIMDMYEKMMAGESAIVSPATPSFPGADVSPTKLDIRF